MYVQRYTCNDMYVQRYIYIYRCMYTYIHIYKTVCMQRTNHRACWLLWVSSVLVLGYCGCPQTRVKGVAGVGHWTLASACSGGLVKLWDVRAMQSPLAEHATGARITCLSAADEQRNGQEGVRVVPRKGTNGRKHEGVEEVAHTGATSSKATAPTKIDGKGKLGGTPRPHAAKPHAVVGPVQVPTKVSVDDREKLARQGVVKDGVVEFVDNSVKLKPVKKRRKRSAEERSAPSLEAAEQAAMELGLNVDVHEQHAVMEEAHEQAGGKRGRGRQGQGRQRRQGRGGSRAPF